MKGEFAPERLKAAEALRQAILDWLHGHPGAVMAEIAAALPEHEVNRIRGAVTGMITLKEIAAHGDTRRREFTAVARVTVSAEAVKLGKRARNQRYGANRRALLKAVREADSDIEADERVVIGGRYAEGERNRQAILDYLNAHPWSKSGQVAAHLVAIGIASASRHPEKDIASRMLRMADYGEVERQEIRSGCGREYMWRALVRTTVPAHEVLRVRRLRKLEHDRKQAAAECVTVTRGARTIHRGTERCFPLPNQRGQGAVERRGHINCEQNY